MIWFKAYFLRDNTSPYEITNLLDSAEPLKWLFVEKKKKILIWSNISWCIIKYKSKDIKYHRKETA